MRRGGAERCGGVELEKKILSSRILSKIFYTRQSASLHCAAPPRRLGHAGPRCRLAKVPAGTSNCHAAAGLPPRRSSMASSFVTRYTRRRPTCESCTKMLPLAAVDGHYEPVAVDGQGP